MDDMYLDNLTIFYSMKNKLKDLIESKLSLESEKEIQGDLIQLSYRHHKDLLISLCGPNYRCFILHLSSHVEIITFVINVQKSKTLT